MQLSCPDDDHIQCFHYLWNHLSLYLISTQQDHSISFNQMRMHFYKKAKADFGWFQGKFYY